MIRILLLLLLLAAPCLARDYEAKILRAVDGDTVTAYVNLGAIRRKDQYLGLNLWVNDGHLFYRCNVRLSNGNAPEKDTDAGKVSQAWMATMVTGKAARITTDNKREFDKYGRLLARVVINGVDLGDELIRTGNGHGGPGRKD